MKSMRTFYHKLTLVTLFAIAMGFLEAVVVVYLRVIYYPDGFDFPLTMIEPDIFLIELVRELTTLVMLICIGLLTAETRHGKFAGFLFAFGVWDIIYYLGLKLFLDWPESLFTWDILFLIPITWIGPVLAPIICALTMILVGALVGWFEARKVVVKFGKLAWILMILGSVIIFLSFIEDYSRLLINSEVSIIEGSRIKPGFNEAITSYVPEKFNWLIFSLGELIVLTSIFLIYRNNLKDLKQQEV